MLTDCPKRKYSRSRSRNDTDIGIIQQGFYNNYDKYVKGFSGKSR